MTNCSVQHKACHTSYGLHMNLLASLMSEHIRWYQFCKCYKWRSFRCFLVMVKMVFLELWLESNICADTSVQTINNSLLFHPTYIYDRMLNCWMLKSLHVTHYPGLLILTAEMCSNWSNNEKKRQRFEITYCTQSPHSLCIVNKPLDSHR